ncbi:MAG: DUF2110 family protein [Promethearchaeota archaeon]|nr:MAG: DUF2110 family protein [Candidatus Lokiarchaeota archaeon]
MKKIVLLDKIYNIPPEKSKHEVATRYLKYLHEITKGFSKTKISIKKLRNFDNRFEILIQGPEETFVYNLLRNEIGSIIDFDDVKSGNIYKGTLVDVGKYGFGLFVDCGIVNPKTDVLMSLNDLRGQLCKGKKISLREIVKTYDLMDHFPFSIKITRSDEVKKELQGIIHEDSLTLFEKLTNEHLDAVFVSGASKNQFKKAIIKKGHFRDIVSIERFGFLEHAVILRENTTAQGIIADIGRYLRGCKLSALKHDKIEQLFT